MSWREIKKELKLAASSKSQAEQPAPEVDDATLFRQQAQVTKRIHNDTVPPPKPQLKKRQTNSIKDTVNASREAGFYFSDTFEANLPVPLKYVAEGESSYLAKQLRRGDFAPEVLLDLHGFTQLNAKRELAAMLKTCEREQVDCCCIMHGFGEGVLKQRIPHWLVQHPLVRAFHQAPREWGGDAAILVLLKVTV